MKILTIEMPDGSLWAVPVEVIAKNRAKHFAHEFGGDTQRSLIEDTAIHFDREPDAVEDWARNNMNWKDVENQAFQLEYPPEPDYQEGWLNGAMEVVPMKEADA